MGLRSTLIFAILAALASGGARADISIRPGRLAQVAVSYRQKGEREWRQGMPLCRVGTGPDSQAGEARLEGGDRESWPYPLGNLFAGSVLDLKPDTGYEIKLA